MREICMSGSTSGDWKRSHGEEPAVNRSGEAVDVENLPQQKVRHDKP